MWSGSCCCRRSATGRWWGLLHSCTLVLTDSGGLQEEAPGLGKPVLVLREVTERQEAVEAGAAMLVGTDTRTIAGAASALLASPSRYARMAQAVNPYGDGHSAERIVAALRGQDVSEWAPFAAQAA